MKCEIMYGRKESTIWFGNINVTYRYLFANKYINIVCFPPGVQYNFEKKNGGEGLTQTFQFSVAVFVIAPKALNSIRAIATAVGDRSRFCFRFPTFFLEE